MGRKTSKITTMYKELIILIFLSLINCCAKKEPAKIVIDAPKDKIMFEKDKKQIADCFIDKVEYFRKYHDYETDVYVNSPDNIKKEQEEYYSKYVGADIDPANFFEPYANRFNLKRDRSVTSPFPTIDQLEVTTDTIVYNEDELICFAFLVIKGKYSHAKDLEEARDNGREYDARAVIGLRQTKEAPFEIYPVTKFSAIGYEAYNTAVEQIKNLYFTKLKGDYTEGTQYTGKNTFNSNVGDKYFFKKSPYFKKTKNGLYYFQIYKELKGNTKEYQYQKCN
jgi:hypothetical protein